MSKIMSYAALGYDPSIYYYNCANAKGYNNYYAKKNIYVNQEINKDAMYYVRSVAHNADLIVKMPLAKENESQNANGWLRDNKYYFNELFQKVPDAFSQDNIERLHKGNSLIIDNKFIEKFPEFKEFEGQKCIHHHIGEQMEAVAIPESLHIGHTGIHEAEQQLGITYAAKLYGDFYKECNKYGITIERVDELYTEYLKDNDICIEPNDIRNIYTKDQLEHGSQLSDVLNISNVYDNSYNIENNQMNEDIIGQSILGQNNESNLENKEDIISQSIFEQNSENNLENNEDIIFDSISTCEIIKYDSSNEEFHDNRLSNESDTYNRKYSSEIQAEDLDKALFGLSEEQSEYYANNEITNTQNNENDLENNENFEMEY